MPNADDVLWIKQTFGADMQAGLAGTPFSVDMLVAVACQETGFIWASLRKKLPVATILSLCVGDTLDHSAGRSAFPQTKADLIAKPNGQEMFDKARQALKDMAAYIPGYDSAVKNPDKFCHGFGLFQYDLQFFLVDPQYFLRGQYAIFSKTLGKCIEELASAQKSARLAGKLQLSDLEMAAVAIAYNTGSYNAALGLKQGYFDKVKYYGEYFYDYLQLSKSVKPAVPASPAPTV